MALQKEEAAHKPGVILTEQEQIKPHLTEWPDTLVVKEKMSARAYMQEGTAPEYPGKLRLSWYWGRRYLDGLLRNHLCWGLGKLHGGPKCRSALTEKGKLHPTEETREVDTVGLGQA